MIRRFLTMKISSHAMLMSNTIQTYVGVQALKVKAVRESPESKFCGFLKHLIWSAAIRIVALTSRETRRAKHAGFVQQKGRQ